MCIGRHWPPVYSRYAVIVMRSLVMRDCSTPSPRPKVNHFHIWHQRPKLLHLMRKENVKIDPVIIWLLQAPECCNFLWRDISWLNIVRFSPLILRPGEKESATFNRLQQKKDTSSCAVSTFCNTRMSQGDDLFCCSILKLSHLLLDSHNI